MAKRINQKSGLTLSEVLISALILVLFMSIASEILIQSLRVSREENGIDFIRKEALKGINWLNTDLRRSTGASFIYNTYPVSNVPLAMSFLTNQANVLENKGINKDSVIATPDWNYYIVYYLIPDNANPATGNSTQKYILQRGTNVIPSDPYYDKVFNNISMAAPKPLLSTDLANELNKFISNTVTPRPGTVARNIYEINVIEQENSYVKLSIETRTKNPRGGELKVIYTSRVFMRNSSLQLH